MIHKRDAEKAAATHQLRVKTRYFCVCGEEYVNLLQMKYNNVQIGVALVLKVVPMLTQQVLPQIFIFV